MRRNGKRARLLVEIRVDVRRAHRFAVTQAERRTCGKICAFRLPDRDMQIVFEQLLRAVRGKFEIARAGKVVSGNRGPHSRARTRRHCRGNCRAEQNESRGRDRFFHDGFLLTITLFYYIISRENCKRKKEGRAKQRCAPQKHRQPDQTAPRLKRFRAHSAT